MKDSTMTVKDGKTPFTIKTTGEEHKYGYDASLVNGEKGRIPGISSIGKNYVSSFLRWCYLW